MFLATVNIFSSVDLYSWIQSCVHVRVKRPKFKLYMFPTKVRFVYTQDINTHQTEESIQMQSVNTCFYFIVLEVIERISLNTYFNFKALQCPWNNNVVTSL